MSARQVLDEAMLEDELLSAVVEAAERLGWKVAHIPDRLYKLAAKEGRWDAMRGAKSFPDLVMTRNGRLIFAETKTETGELEPGQAEWLAELQIIPDKHILEFVPCPVEVYLWRPRHWSSGAIERILQ